MRKVESQYINFHKNMFITQDMANSIMEYPVANLGKSYGAVINIFYFCLFYFYLVPFIVFVGFA